MPVSTHNSNYYYYYYYYYYSFLQYAYLFKVQKV